MSLEGQVHIAEWSSSVARRAHNPEVAGSNPVSATKFITVVDTISTTVIFYFLLFCRCFLREIRDFRNISTVEQTVMSHLPQPGVPQSTAWENCNRYKNINDKLLFYIDIGNRPRPGTTPVMDGFPLYPRDRKDKKDKIEQTRSSRIFFCRPEPVFTILIASL